MILSMLIAQVWHTRFLLGFSFMFKRIFSRLEQFVQ